MKYALVILLFFINANAKILETQQLFNRSIISVKEKNVSIKKQFYGKVTIDETRIKDVTIRFDGFIDKLYADKLYEFVNTKKPIFRIYSSEIVAAEEELMLAMRLKKNNAMYKSALNKLVSLGIDDRTVNAIQKSQKVLQNIEVFSPMNGYIIKKNVNDKSFIKKGSVIFQVADLSQLWVMAQVYQRDLNFVKKGMSAQVQIEGINQVIKASVDYINPLVDAKNQTIGVRLIIDNPDIKIYPNMFAKIDLFKPLKTILTLPRSAVLTKGDQHYVFKPLNNSEFEPILVSAKRIDSNMYEIQSGLKKGEKVIDKVLFMLDSDAITNGLYSTDDAW